MNFVSLDIWTSMGEIIEVKVRVSPCSSEPGVLITSMTTHFIV